jgi:phage terminase small subunit
LALGCIGLIAALMLQAHGHRLEQQPVEPFASKGDAVKRLLLEQCVAFPRFLFSGAWWRAWRQHRRH